jgi:hypothetical protein
LLVHPDAVLASAITGELLQSIPRRHPQICQDLCSIQHRQLPPGSTL